MCILETALFGLGQGCAKGKGNDYVVWVLLLTVNALEQSFDFGLYMRGMEDIHGAERALAGHELADNR